MNESSNTMNVGGNPAVQNDDTEEVKNKDGSSIIDEQHEVS